jgi:putative membrane protein insertion efficiency factor
VTGRSRGPLARAQTHIRTADTVDALADGWPPGGLATAVLVRLLRVYQSVHQGRPPSCRFLPTCSSYAIDAIQLHGPARGSWLAIRRLARCHPWGAYGVDMVPPREVPPC